MLATPYSLPACMARCALASFVEAIIFMDWRGFGDATEHDAHKISDGSQILRTGGTYLGDFLNVPNRLQPQLNLTKSCHVPRTSGSSAQNLWLRSHAPQCAPGKHVCKLVMEGRINKRARRLLSRRTRRNCQVDEQPLCFRPNPERRGRPVAERWLRSLSDKRRLKYLR